MSRYMDWWENVPVAVVFRWLALLNAFAAVLLDDFGSWMVAFFFAILAASAPERTTTVAVHNVTKPLDTDDLDFIVDAVERRASLRKVGHP